MRKGDPDGGHGQWSAHHGAGGCSLACGVDLALVCVVRPCLVRGGRPRTPPHRHPPPLRTFWWRWQARQCVVVGQRPMSRKRRAPWGGPGAWGAGPRGGGQGSRWGREGAWQSEKEEKGKKRSREADGSGHGRCKGGACAMQGRRTGDARRTPWALPWQPHGLGADLRWKGRREDANNAPVQSDQLLHRTGLANQDKEQTGRQTGHVTVTTTGRKGGKMGGSEQARQQWRR